MNDKMKDKMERQVNASIEMMKWAKEGKPLDEQWEELGRMGLSEKERVGVAKCLSAFVSHRNGDHSKCPPTCQDLEYVSKNHDIKSNNLRDMIDEVDHMHKMNNRKEFSDDVLEEWK